MKQLVIDQTHSDLGFKIRHLMVSNIKGTLKNYSGGMNYTMEDMGDAQIRLRPRSTQSQREIVTETHTLIRKTSLILKDFQECILNQPI